MANLLKFYRGATAPATPEVGMIWFNNVTETVDGVAQVKNLIKVYTPTGWEVYGTTDADLQAVVARVTALEGAVTTLKDVTLPALKEELEQAIADAVAAEAEIARAAEEALGKRIDALAAKTVTINEKTTGHVTVSKTTDETTGATVYTVAENDIASAEALAKESEDARAAEKALADRLDIVEGEATVVGSIKKALADAKAYTDEAKAAVIGDATEAGDTLGKLEDRIEAIVANEKTYSVVKMTAEEVAALSNANVKEAYKLIDEDKVAVGDPILVYKDSALKSAAMGTEADAQKLILTYVLADGSESVVPVDLSAFYAESETGNGLQVVDHVISVKVDTASEAFLTVGADGVKLAGVQDAIDAAKAEAIAAIAPAIEALDATVGSQTVAEGKHVAVEVVETDGKLTGLTVVESDIASAAALATLDAEVQEHEVVVSAALNDLNARIEGVVQDLAGKNVDAEGDAYVSATAADNKVTVAATESTKASLALADSAVQTVASETLQVTREANAVNVELCWMEGSF